MPFHQQLKNKIVSKEEALKSLNALRKPSVKIVFTNGCFDILHPGHVDYLCQARDLGDFMVLGLNTDASVKLLNKAPNRPINDEHTRSAVLAGLACIDLIVFFDEATPYELIKFLQPTILVKGNDYKAEEIVGYDIVKSNGGEVITIPMVEGYSTTKLIEKILK
ncbi:D-glycero-beta-D-manno-heptose 1-phosphate adenylyltransferase [Aurantibacillus circumpalustris]|uniref:D-glycero-beta-D-manno-heptose 1-phosphate adenylyltransferase n=1 Tax=Aurantibacillus circumpalustris TaxID=3036359 RepID=UPI00295B6610|nr:D-glycero-beta-D-manno-heptose 1-phosphate adenylyltransferase [Aurantibacillus circumpalustris]